MHFRDKFCHSDKIRSLNSPAARNAEHESRIRANGITNSRGTYISRRGTNLSAYSHNAQNEYTATRQRDSRLVDRKRPANNRIWLVHCGPLATTVVLLTEQCIVAGWPAIPSNATLSRHGDDVGGRAKSRSLTTVDRTPASLARYAICRSQLNHTSARPSVSFDALPGHSRVPINSTENDGMSTNEYGRRKTGRHKCYFIYQLHPLRLPCDITLTSSINRRKVPHVRILTTSARQYQTSSKCKSHQFYNKSSAVDEMAAQCCRTLNSGKRAGSVQGHHFRY